MHYIEAVTLLRRIPVFASLDSPSLKLLAFSSAYLSFDDGEALCHQGDPGDSVFVIDDGAVEVTIEVNGKPAHLANLGRHDLFGEMAVICNLPRTADVWARGPLKVLKIEGDVFLRLVTGNAEASLGVMRVLSERLMRFIELYERLKRSLPAGTCPKAPVAPG
ncbi:MAG: cyclic nucleotide-binding domain-containing protein [Rhodospirillales bacterium]|nr:cyclic nucleotide-binding domain-containing protein [Rhodospirillales bacterium]